MLVLLLCCLCHRGVPPAADREVAGGNAPGTSPTGTQRLPPLLSGLQRFPPAGNGPLGSSQLWARPAAEHGHRRPAGYLFSAATGSLLKLSLAFINFPTVLNDKCNVRCSCWDWSITGTLYNKLPLVYFGGCKLCWKESANLPRKPATVNMKGHFIFLLGSN